ncbi:CIA30 family protein [uncultured Sunxiuqinia sp.]|uniref:CIA30 family protein n=1 Tax=uncultured Sunxiuqinia sp. TaxID=1573825 RepID=UPI002AA6BBCE|nr:CIA30 family protein [uncultured Sunxiuqinia sp.]
MLQIVMFVLLTLTMNPMVLVEFSENSDLQAWFVINDGVMGGQSTSSFNLNADGNGLFKGKVSLENNGGFASVHYRFDPLEIANAKTLALYLKGDGKRYQARIYANTNDRYSYIAYFETSGEWETIEVPLANMYPSFRGRKLDQPNFSATHIEEIALLIGNKKAESFQLEIQKILLM